MQGVEWRMNLLNIGLVGLAGSGKTSLFRLLTGASDPAYGRVAEAAAQVPDPRVDALSSLYNPKKTTYAQLRIIDLPGLRPGSGREEERAFLDAVRKVDVLIYVLRAFTDAAVPPALETVDPLMEAEALEDELTTADWSLTQARLERLANPRRGEKPDPADTAVLERVNTHLEAGGALRALELSEAERLLLRQYDFLTMRAVVACVNVDEDALAPPSWPSADATAEWAGRRGIPLVPVSVKLEAEIAELPADERRAFLEDIGAGEPGVARLARAAYAAADFITYFTVGEDEVRAWSVRRGSNAQEAAGRIHSDLAKGFVRAEVADGEELLEAGSLTALREAGRLRLEGREYIVADGDVITFRVSPRKR